LLKAGLVGGMCALALASAAAAQTTGFTIAGGELKAALDAYARQSGVQLIYRVEDVRGVRSNGARGQLSRDQALAEILAGTPFTVRRDASGAVAIVRVEAEEAPLRPAAPDPPVMLEEVIVTGKTGAQPARSVSGSVSAMSGAQLEAIGAQGFGDYLTRTPGVVYNAGVPGLSTASIRGVATTVGVSNNQGTTGYFINDVPLTDPFYSAGIPDIDTFDVDNVTVLRGPQGTLFGAASLGGAINYQAARPNLSAYQLHAQATAQSTRDGAPGGAARIMLNAPIVEDRLAVRAVYVRRSDGGYVDNVVLGRANSNRTTVEGGRLQAAWTPTATTRISYLFLQQSQDTADVGYEEPVRAGPLKKASLIGEPASFRTRVNSLRVDHDLAFATLTATAAYHEKSSTTVGDVTQFFAASLPGAAPVSNVLAADSHGAAFELRLASPAGRRLEYLIGAYHDEIDETIRQAFSAPNAAAVIETVYGPTYGSGVGAATAPGGVFLAADVPFKGQETAAFGEASYHVSDQLKLTAGGRLFDTRSISTTTASGFFNLLSSGAIQSVRSGAQRQTGFSPKAAITWTPNPDLLAYGLVSKGFRYGGPNINPSSPGFAIPASFDSDSLVNYELGVRTNWLDHRLQVDATAFFIDWSDIQLQLYSPLGLTYLANAGKAASTGVEATASWRIRPELALQSNLTYLNAALSEDFDPGGGQPIVPKGARLPGASRWQVSSTLSYQWTTVPAAPVLTLSHHYVSRAPGDLAAGAAQGGYNQFDARATFHLDRVDISVFAQNIGNSRGVTSASLLSGPLQQFVLRPFTVGMTADFKM
jgi:outer membrane receptor protein involved in Fe transport